MADDPWAAFNPQGGAPVRPHLVPLPAKPAPPQGKVVKDNYVIDPNTASAQPITGLPENGGDRLSPEALDAETTNWILTGKMSPLGMGNGPLRVQIENNRPVIMKKYGVTDNALPAVQKQFDADSKAYSARTQQISLMNQAMDAAKQHVEQISGYLDHLPAQTDYMPVNAVSLGVQRAGSGKTVTDLDATIPLLQGEIAKIMTANPASGAGQLTDDARREFDILNSSRSPAARKEAMQALMEMVNRKITGTQAESDRLSQRLNGGITSYALGTGDGPSVGGGPPENPIANGGDGDMGPTLGPSGGDTRSVIDLKRKALAEKLSALITKGADRNTIMGFAVGANPAWRNDPKFSASIDEALRYRKDHPKAKYPIDPSLYTTEVPLSAQEKVGNAVAQSGLGAAMMNAGDAATAGNMGNLTGDQEGVNRALAVSQAQHPTAAVAGTVGGGASAAAALDALLGVAGVGAGVGRAIAADTTYGATAGATAAPEGQRIEGALEGGAAGLAGSAGGNMLGRLSGSALRGVTNPTVGYVAKDVPLTIGQAVGQSGRVGAAVKGIEDRLSGIPVVGDAINARRLEGLQKMNAKAFDRALEPINETAGGLFGEQAIAHAQDKVSGAFTKALAGKSAGLDHGFIVDAERAKMSLEKLPDSVRDEVNNQVDHVINNYFDDSGQISGDNMQALLRDLGGIKRGYQGNPLGHRIGQVVDQFTDSVEGLFKRQAPDVMPQYDAAKKAFKRVSTLEDAVLKGKQTGGVFTSAQLGMADRANTIKYGGKHRAAAGGGEFHDFQRNMQDVLPNKVPDSGTAGRLLIPGALIAGGTGAGAASGDAEKGLTLGALLAMAYSKVGQRALTASVLKRGSAAVKAGEALRKRAPLLGHAAVAPVVLGPSGD